MNDTPGHLFVVRGRIEAVAHDVAIIPTDQYFNVSAVWRPVVGDSVANARPELWPATGFGQSVTDPAVWFIDVGDVVSGDAGLLNTRLAALLAGIAASEPAIGKGRKRLRVATPVLATSGGGMDSRKGDILAQLTQTLTTSATDLGVDVVLVTPDRALFSAAQHYRRERYHWALDEAAMKDAMRLGRLAIQGHLALFLGAGVSIGAGLPGWSDLLARLAERSNVAVPDSTRFPALDQAQLLEKMIPNLGEQVSAIIAETSTPSLAHALLAGLNCNEVVTTNYDQLYETALRATEKGAAISVLPRQSSVPQRPWILKMHGDVAHPESIVLTRRRFVTFDASAKPAGSLLQSMLLTKHLLVVGASLTDDNVSRLTLEVDEFRKVNKLKGEFGTFLDVSDDQIRRLLWSDQLDWISCRGSDTADRVRYMELFLDAVAAYASTDSSWLLDQRFEGLLSRKAQAAAATARDLLAKTIKFEDSSMQPLIRALTELGANRS
ncbi:MULTISPECIES: SIR2 family protein [Actinomycetes]|uniref:SIR2 family protein n=2 Tax=Actinomycetota TaxID=201174 RepID=UPI000524049D|nr:MULTISPECIES: SIR2 family protein [Actinomycetes]